MTTSSRRRVLYVFCSQNYSGAEFVFERLMLHNRAAVEPFALCPPGAFAERLRREGIHVITTRALLSLGRQEGKLSRGLLASHLLRRMMQAAFAITKAIRTHDIEIVHANNVAAAAYTILPMHVSKALRRKIAWLWTTQDKKYLVPRDTAIARTCCKLLDATITVSQSVADEYPEHAAKIRVVYSGLDENFWQFDEAGRKAFRTRYGLDEATIAIGLIGVVSERKGHHILLPAFEQLLPRVQHPVHLFFIGSTVPQYESYQAHWQGETRKRDLGAQVTWTGKIEDMKSVYAGLDIVVNSTISQYGEPLGTTIYEAMSCERVALATRTGGSPEIITDEVDGFLCAPDSADDLAARLNAIIEMWDGLGELRHEARHKVRKSFTVTSTAYGYNTLYDGLMKR